ncbi:UDP-N-acetylmuramate--L-alanine ligase [Hugenholtzia roseola]|uniref:UDP-N-acetylmuramate--L-alanine ligase n=1 Tax=Hugenholtzia roseola TaxID=1002 RepID=UPI00047A5F61|nr:Mur ligase family protein [Hugenholtzia roseola]
MSKRIHFIGIGGSVMHHLAIDAHHKGFEVSGSDDAIYEPSRSALATHQLLPASLGWDASRISSDIETIILGMHARLDNPELVRAQELGLEILSFPAYIYRQSQNKERIVIAGSHGKTTTTAMVMHVLQQQHYQFDYLVGAYVEGFEGTVSLTEEAPLIVIEGDEYLSSALDPTPKFLHYQHHIGVLNGIAWDHINVYPEEATYIAQFRKFAEASVKAGTLIYNEDDPKVREICADNAAIREDTIKIAYKAHPFNIRENKTLLKTHLGDIEVPFFGEHNMTNLAAAKAVCARLGVSESQFYDAMRSFRGASLRLEVLLEKDDRHIYRDFAHAPSKVAASVQAVKAQYPNRRLIACLELHTFSSLDKRFLENYRHSLKQADKALLYFNPQVLAQKNLPTFESQELRDAFQREDLLVFTDIAELVSFVAKEDLKHTNLLLMSSGKWGGIDWQEIFNHA